MYIVDKNPFLFKKRGLSVREVRGGSRGEDREEKQREEGLTSQQETGTMESPARIRHVALTDIT